MADIKAILHIATKFVTILTDDDALKLELQWRGIGLLFKFGLNASHACIITNGTHDRLALPFLDCRA